MQKPNLFNGCYPCPAPENCPHACRCEENPHPNAPFSRSLICFLNYSSEIAKDVYEKQTQLPRYTFGETLNQWLWLNRGTAESLATAIFDYGEQNRDFTEFEIARQFLKNTIGIARVNFLQKPLALLNACASEHDKKALDTDIFGNGGAEAKATE